MDNLRKEFIKEILETLKIPMGAFNVGTVADEIQHIPATNFKEFHKALFGTDHSYLNGMDRIIKVAEQFKPIVVDDVEAKANELIALTYSMNNTVFDNAKTSGRTFEDELEGTTFNNLDDDIAILNQVKPYTDHKQLVANISCYGTSVEQLKAFKNAIEYSESYSGAIECSRVSKMIGSK